MFFLFQEISSVFESPDDFINEYHIHNSGLWKLHHAGMISSDFLRPERWRLTLSARGLSPFPDLCHSIDHHYLSTLCSLPSSCEGADRILTRIQNDFLIGIISNGFTDTQYNKLNVSGLNRFISRMIISDEIGIQKPDPRIFKYALDETGADHNPIFIGDNFDTDIIGALNAGWKAIWYNPEGKTLNSDNLNKMNRGIDRKLFLGTIENLDSIIPILYD